MMNKNKGRVILILFYIMTGYKSRSLHKQLNIQVSNNHLVWKVLCRVDFTGSIYSQNIQFPSKHSYFKTTKLT